MIVLYIKTSDGNVMGHWRKDQNYGDAAAQEAEATEIAQRHGRTMVAFALADPEDVFGGPQVKAPIGRHSSMDIVNGVVTFDAVKAKRIEARLLVDKKTGTLDKTFEHAGKVFTLDESAMHNFHGISEKKEAQGLFPLKWPTADGEDSITIADSTEWGAFYDAAFIRVFTKRTEGQTLKEQVNAASTIEDVNALIAANAART